MSSLSKLTFSVRNEGTYQLKIERIHPDAPSLDWINQQEEKTVKVVLLFRTLIFLESNHSETGKISKLYQYVFSLLSPFIEEEYGEIPELNKYTEITEYGSDILEDIVDQVIVSVKQIEADINDNWEKGQIKNFNPYKENEGVPFVSYEIVLSEPLLENMEESLVSKNDFSPLSISCKFK
ncbi:hypothetical protein [Aureispira sp. CCB-E]|uniref:hypothetical protein n=1 Tax=Aureispira sp. CCB-E TaxID=3051121 RepID=UPI002868E378|nr:hypothetical protein [Aureispira sp. CCB-E]WMX16997.1 hypothetical protein QP953_11500 [Aureispira sp. CCB-E]